MPPADAPTRWVALPEASSQRVCGRFDPVIQDVRSLRPIGNKSETIDYDLYDSGGISPGRM